MNLTTVNIYIGIIGTLTGLLLSSINLKSQMKKKIKEETIELATIQSDIKVIKDITEKNSNAINEISKSMATTNEKIARIEERVDLFYLTPKRKS